MSSQGQSASSLWGANNTFNGLESNWGMNTPVSSAANNSAGWGSSPMTSLSSNSNNQGYNMQSGASSAVGDSGNGINSNPMLGANRHSWGAPGTVPPSQSSGIASRMPPTQMPRSSGGSNGNNMQVTLPASGAQPNGPQSTQSGIATSAQSSGPNNVSVSMSQGTSAFPGAPGFQKSFSGSDSNWSTSTGFVMNPGTSIMNTSGGNNAQSGDNLGSRWGTPSSSDTSSSIPTGTSSWGNPNLTPGSDWGGASQSASMSQPQQQQQQLVGAPANPSQQVQQSSTPQFSNPSAPQGQLNPADQQRPSSWAQAAGKGLNLHSTSNSATGAAGGPSATDLERENTIREAIESHDGWGKRPVRQDTEWNVEASPKMQRKFSTAPVAEPAIGANNMWNNNNGTAIWEPNKDGTTAWNNAPARAPGPPPGQPGWNSATQKAPDPSGAGNWAGGQGPGPGPGPGGMGQAPGQGPGPSMGQGSDKTIGSWGPPEGNQPANNNWGGTTETGSWGGNYGTRPEMGANSGSISNWGEPDNANWNNAQRRPVNTDGTSYWGEPQPKPPPQPHWNNPAGPPPNQPAMMASGPPNQQPMMARMKSDIPKPSGWGDPMGPPDPKIDDGTSVWAANNQQQAQAAGWGDTTSQGQWNPAVGKPKPPPMTPGGASWAGDNDMNWNQPKDDVWNEENMGGWDDADMGTWNDSAQENNSSWNSATGWNRNKRNSLKGPLKFPGGNHPPQRSRLLQQMMDMGFKKDEAQHALINNNMNIQNALADLYNRQGANVGKKDADMDVFQMEKQKMVGYLPDGSGANDDISDTQSDSSSFVPNVNSMQNTPFQNAQSQIPNQFPPFKGPSLSQSSLNPNNPSINALQQKIIQKFHNQQQQPPPPPTAQNSINQSQGPIGRGQLQPGNQNPAVQQQMAQQQILQQLRMAVQAGLISPQLLNQQLPPPVLVMLQQLLQQQQMLQQLITTQQMLQQPKMGVNPLVQRQQLEQVAAKINNIKQQILLLQKQISQAQNALLKPQQQQQQQPPQTQSAATPESDSLTPLQTDLGNISISTSQAQPQSRLTQWKRPTPEREETPPATDVPSTTATSGADTTNSLNKAVGSKPIPQSQSTPNLRRFDELGLSQLGGDWSNPPTSSSATQNWPSSSASSTMASSSPSDGQITSAETKESQSTTTTSTTSSVLMNDSIPEFVPGKPWQGIPKNVEDDPHITPGSFSRSLSVNTIKDDYLLSLTKSSPNETSSWPSKPASSTSQNKPWADPLTPTSFTSEVWGVPLSKGGAGGSGAMSRPPPGLPQNKGGWNPGVNRQHSWAPGTRTDPASAGGNWDRGAGSPPSTSLILKNLTPQIDGSTLRTLCMQHGPLQGFYINLGHGQALVKYATKEEAIKAQKSLNTCLLGNTTIVAEFVSDSEVSRFVDQQSAISAPSQWSQSSMAASRPTAPSGIGSRSEGGNSSWSMSAPTSSFNNSPLPGSSNLPGNNMWGTGVGGGMSSTGLWGNSTLEDHGSHNLLGNMLGETM